MPPVNKNWFTNEIYKSETDGVGYGRVIDNKVKILKLLTWGVAGFEYFWNNHVSYLYVVKSGGHEIIAYGKTIVDWVAGGEVGLPTFEATGVSAPATRASAPAGVRIHSEPGTGVTVEVANNKSHSVEVYDLD